ncbi:hypothetical protein HDC37_001361 [Microbacterium sp. AK009]|uniref:DUF7882 family protein n=1 Tax=Microbacterium sp. AK009 TaxID=2723068 RepID=UPI0015C7F42D|nr:hypothetical protein [Microbacterium sp. AK009]NYF16536.1 hypothetical protein [Microbacterium sp. AK009]
MGHLIYGVAPAIRVNDRALRHLQAVVLAKLRRNESFSFEWESEPDIDGDDAIKKGGDFGAVWISQGASLYFSYDKAPDDSLNMAWLKLLSETVASTGRLRLLPEPGAPAPSR